MCDCCVAEAVSCVTCVTRVKYMGLFSYLLLLGVASVDTWSLIGDRAVSHVSYTKNLVIDDFGFSS